ncbi:MAG: 2-hydroxyacid dehydrogenase [Candidatus Thorarchaeota archaeon]
MPFSVFVTREIPDDGLEILKDRFSTTVWTQRSPPTVEQITENAVDCQGLVTLLSDRIDSDLLDSLPELRVIAQYAVGYDNIDVSAASKRGVIVTNTPGVLTETTADFTWALIMAAARRTPEADQYVRTSKWEIAWEPKMLLGKDVHGAILGVVGMGRIGEAVALRARGFSMKIIYCSRSVNDRTERVERETGAKRVGIESLLSESDIVSLHVPLTPKTTGMIGAGELAQMKPDSILINTSRGAVVDEEALADALESGAIGAAGLDVFRREPIEKDSRLLSLTNLVLAPHIGSASYATRSRMAVMCAENLTAALKGTRPPNIVNPEVL